jgi:hypothetical protein
MAGDKAFGAELALKAILPTERYFGSAAFPKSLLIAEPFLRL